MPPQIWVPLIITIVVTLIINAALIAHYTGKQEQKMIDHKEVTTAEFARHEQDLTTLYERTRNHESTDQSHFQDNDRHWVPQERGWLNIRFEEMGKQMDARFDMMERMIEKLGVK